MEVIIKFIMLALFFFVIGFSWKLGCSVGKATGDLILEKYLDWKKTWRKNKC